MSVNCEWCGRSLTINYAGWHWVRNDKGEVVAMVHECPRGCKAGEDGLFSRIMSSRIGDLIHFRLTPRGGMSPSDRTPVTASQPVEQ